MKLLPTRASIPASRNAKPPKRDNHKPQSKAQLVEAWLRRGKDWTPLAVVLKRAVQ